MIIHFTVAYFLVTNRVLQGQAKRVFELDLAHILAYTQPTISNAEPLYLLIMEP